MSFVQGAHGTSAQASLHKFQLQPVFLNSISDNDQNDENLEPQMVRIRSSNLARLYLDSARPINEFSANNIRISSVTIPGQQPQPLINSGESRVAIENFNMFWQPLNITPYNNSYTWILMVGATKYTFTDTLSANVPANYTFMQLLNSFVTSMNADAVTVLGAGTYFSYTIDGTGRNALFSSSLGAGNSFYWLNTSPFIVNGSSVTYMPNDNTPNTSFNIGPARMLYSRYVDIVCNDLYAWNKNPSKSINVVSNNVVFRQDLQSPNDNWTYFTNTINLQWFNWNYIANGNVFTFALYDEYGNLFYTGPNPYNVSSTLNWTMTLLIES